MSLIGHLRDRKLFSLFLIGFLLLGSNVALFNYIVYVLLGPPYSLNKAFASWIFIVMIVGIFKFRLSLEEWLINMAIQKYW